jgi:hypothetical protein
LYIYVGLPLMSWRFASNFPFSESWQTLTAQTPHKLSHLSVSVRPEAAPVHPKGESFCGDSAPATPEVQREIHGKQCFTGDY